MIVVDDTNFISAHLLHRKHILDSECVAVNVLLYPISRRFEVDLCPLFEEQSAAVALAFFTSVGAAKKTLVYRGRETNNYKRHIRSEGIIELY